MREDAEKKELCKVKFTENDLQLLRDAIEDLYYFEFVIDDIPVRGFIGHLEEGGFLPHNHKVYLWAHLLFKIEYNGNQIIFANVSTKEQAPVALESITAPFEVAFTYSVKWYKTSTPFSERGKRIHWLSIINSMVLVFLLIGFVVIILTRVLKSDFARYNVDDEESDDLDQEDNGWKIIHTDVFRPPACKGLFCAILGCGCQFLALATGMMLMAIFGMFNVHRHGAINTAGIVLYAFTSFGYPLTIIGGIFGKNWANGLDAPCRTKNIAREIPSVPWYRSAFAHCLVGGFLPFSAISVEMYYIFATLWGREYYTLYGILFIVYGILLSVTACISVALTYFQLSAEDYRWWWRSIFSAGSTGVFVFLYAWFYYFKRSQMFGALQTIEFFGYTAMTCYVFFLMLGTISFFASLNFVRYIYVNLKMD
ncbi:hypothetical protein KUTeg_011165 [Tegillarca granosa]|uniref:Transmembrane 9 superfamily member n=1 Tax=Tegillarca granosa TaxID=220873 RepID=A0ABQ9F6U4_TEGGR|nr:hypothetical protein KUTeg_011165 [Tegillarca granosa]